MPILYFFAALTFLVTYWIDKFTLLRVYRKPPSYGTMLMKVTRRLISVALILHFGFSFWMLSNSLMFDTYTQNAIGAGTTTAEAIQRDSYYWAKIDMRLNQYHTFAYALAFGLFLVAYGLKTLIVSVACKKSRSVGGVEEAYSSNYFDNLEDDHLEVFTKKTASELSIYKSILDSPLYENANKDVQNDIVWYIARLEAKLGELETVQKGRQEKGAPVARLYVSDHTYDISEIYPYSYFLENENLLKRDLT